MKNKKMLLVAVIGSILSGCATAYRINAVSLGMTKKEVIEVMGEPESTSATYGVEFMNYSFREGFGFAYPKTMYQVQIVGGRVISYGRYGDFDTTHQVKQVIETQQR